MIYLNTFHNFVRQGGVQKSISGKSSSGGQGASKLDNTDTLLGQSAINRKTQLTSLDVRGTAALSEDHLFES